MAKRTTEHIHLKPLGEPVSERRGLPNALAGEAVRVPEVAEDLETQDAADFGHVTARAIAREELGRELSARTVLFHEAVAERMGLSVTDHKCLDIAGRAAMDGPLTAGRLAELTGLTTGAITGVLDRLEKGGFIRREKDPHDRRQVLVKILPDRQAEYVDMFTPFAKAWEELASRYTPEEMARVEDYCRAAVVLLEKETERVRHMTPTNKPSGQEATEASAPFNDEKVGYLVFARGATNTRVGAETGGLLYRGHFVGATPRITTQDGQVVIDYPRGAFRGVPWKRSASELGIQHAIPWHIVVRGGAAKVFADLRAIKLRGIEISGGATELWIKLPAPEQTVALRIAGGVHRVTILRPEGVPARFLVKSGASGLTIDTLQLGSVGGKMNWESPDYASSVHRYDIEVLGGANHLTLGTYAPLMYATRDE